MTYAELLEIVKDHRDVWGEHLFPEIHKAHGVIWWANRAMGGTPVPAALVEPTLLGLGVAWLVENGGSARIYPPLPTRPEYFVGTDDCGGWRLPSLLASVYAAIAEVKAARMGSA